MQRKAARYERGMIWMSADELRGALADLGFSQEGFARLVGVEGRTVRCWVSGERRVPGPVAVLIRLLLRRPDVRSVVEEGLVRRKRDE